MIATPMCSSSMVVHMTMCHCLTGSAWFTHAMACKAAGVGLLAPSKSLLLTCLVTAWGARLAGYLFYRVLVVGKDGALPKQLLHVSCIQ